MSHPAVSDRGPRAARTPPGAVRGALVLLAVALGAARGDEAAIQPKGIPVPPSEDGYRCPVEPGGNIVQGNFGTYSHQDTYAWDYQAGIGTPVVAARSGVVVLCKMDSCLSGDQRYAPDANMITIRHSDGEESSYSHLLRGSNLVRKGEFVLQGERLALSGESGFAGMPHCHYEVRKGNRSIASRFVDFRADGGVPQQGASHGAPAPPAVPQKRIAACKSAWRAARHAAERGWADIGLALVAPVLRARGDDGYYYRAVLEAQRAAFSATVAREVDRCAAAPALAPGDVALLQRFVLALPDDPDLADVRAQAQARLAALPEDARKPLDAARAPRKALIRALTQECEEDATDASAGYLALAARLAPPDRDEALALLRRLIGDETEAGFRELADLRDQAGHALAQHRAILAREARPGLERARAWIALREKHFSEDRDRAAKDRARWDEFRKLLTP